MVEKLFVHIKLLGMQVFGEYLIETEMICFHPEKYDAGDE